MKKRGEVEPIRQPTLFELQESSESTDRPITEGRFLLPNIFLGTSSFTALGWEGSFYPIGMRPKVSFATMPGQFQTVQIDSLVFGQETVSANQVLPSLGERKNLPRFFLESARASLHDKSLLLEISKIALHGERSLTEVGRLHKAQGESAAISPTYSEARKMRNVRKNLGTSTFFMESWLEWGALP